MMAQLGGEARAVREREVALIGARGGCGSDFGRDGAVWWSLAVTSRSTRLLWLGVQDSGWGWWLRVEAENGRGREWGPSSVCGKGRCGVWQPARRATSEGGRCRVGTRWAGAVRMGENRGGESADRWSSYCACGLNQIKPIQNNSNEFEFISSPFKLHFIQTWPSQAQKFWNKILFWRIWWEEQLSPYELFQIQNGFQIKIQRIQGQI
jgi:hypothetical protein